MASPDYIDEDHLMVVTPDKQPVAYCVGWYDQAKPDTGYIEPVGTHAQFRQRGFAKAIIRDCFKRMMAHGIKFTEIASPAEPNVATYHYDALSPMSRREVHRYAQKPS
jgi:ribosomal protein S18 acetylase RimI-like enzyme